VSVNGEPVRARLTDIGYVPQEDIVHRALTVREALTYSARLRLPDDARPAEVAAAVDRVLAEVELTDCSDTRIASLSGGQRKRTGVAVELLSRPSLLFLDEPTTGLDPELETRLMRLLRSLANGARSVTVVTHATKNLGLCDKLAVMGRGGELSYFGPPQGALEFFGVGCYDDIYRALRDRPSAEWRALYETMVPGRADPPHTGAWGHPQRRRGLVRQTGVLAARYAKLIARDRRNLLILFGQVPLLGFAMASLFKPSVFEHGHGHASNSTQLLFLLVTTSIWLGSITAARELVKERAVFRRESAAGVRLSSYLCSKVLVLFCVATLQTIGLVAVVTLLRPLHDASAAYLQIGLILVVTSMVAVTMGLAISGLVRSQDQATSFIPLALIPQLFFAGAIVPITRMGEPISTLSAAIFSQWSFAGVGTATGMNTRIVADPAMAHTNGYGTAFFDVSTPLACATLAVFAVAFLAIAATALRKRST
jgi:energy-coupling factor transporter ATP-binding protein EcfA2